MYLPEDFIEHDNEKILAFVNEHAFATIMSCHAGVPSVSHIPLLVEDGQPLRLRGHLSRANTHWQQWFTQEQLLAIFQGPHCYVSPANYPQGEGVPTWNYTAVHMHGRARLIMDTDELRELVHALSDKYELM